MGKKNNVFQEPSVSIANWLPNKTPLAFLSTKYTEIFPFFFPYPPLKEDDPI